MITSLHLGKEERQQYWDLLQTFDDVFLDTGDTVYHHHRLLGYPFQMQGDMQLLCQMASLRVKQWIRLDEEAKASIKTSCAGYLGYLFKNQKVNKLYRKPLRHLLMHKL